MAAVTRARSLHLEFEYTYQVATHRVFRALTTEVGAWWTDPHRMLSHSSSLNLDPVPGGHFLETAAKGSSWIWATVTGVEPDRCLELTGRFGMSGAVEGRVCYELRPKGRSATILKLTHSAVGDVGKSERKEFAAGWEQLLNRKLRGFLRRNSKRR
ncbi:MAG: SRPBCC domain-containing protein [Thermoplasmata archaeon]|nr:SRPBCC domain-containing protein [Thermoplasmata archaeon]